MSIRRPAFYSLIAALTALLFAASAAAHEPAKQEASKPPAAAVIEEADLRLEGRFTQGGLVLGTVAPGSEVTVEGRPVRVSAGGRFVFGFGRDHAPSAKLTLVLPGGQVVQRTLDVEPRTYRVQRIDGLPPKQVTPPKEVLDRIRADNVKIGKARANDTAQTWFAGGFVWPALGPISGVYGSQRILNGEPRRPHYGVDVARPTGTPVTAPAPGRVRLAENDLYFTGGTVILDHGHGVSSAFLHMSRVHVAVGDFLDRGELLGEIGATGRVTGAHLDWRINWFNVRLDPELVVPPMPKAPTN